MESRTIRHLLLLPLLVGTALIFALGSGCVTRSGAHFRVIAPMSPSSVSTAELPTLREMAMSITTDRPAPMAIGGNDDEVNDALRQHVFTRRKAGVWTTPKYPDRAWEWFMERRVPEGELGLPRAYREVAFAQTLQRNMDRSTLRSQTPNWTPIAPDGSDGVQPAGRLIEMVVDPNNDSIIYVASASGGIYKTTNRGLTWANITDGFLPSIGMGSITMSPFNSSNLYIGLGEGVPGAHYEPIGSGIYRTTDAGSTWSLVPNTQGFSYVTDIRVLANENQLLVAVKGLRDGTGAGVYFTSDGGANWQSISSSPAFSIDVDPTNRNIINVTLGALGESWGQIFYTNNGGQSWTQTFPGQSFNNTGVFRIELTRSGQRMYALVAYADNSLGGMLRSDNGGASWSLLPLNGIPTSGDYKPGQMAYNCSIGANPFNPDIVFMGSNLRMYSSSDGGQNWAPRSDWAGDAGLPYVHADHHSIRWGTNANTIYFGTDGGFFMSTDAGTSWTERNLGLQVMQVYRMDNSPVNATAVIMGTQDNDKYLRRPDGTWHHYPNTFGDCMEVICHPTDANVFMGTGYYGANVRMTTNGGNTWDWLRTYTNQFGGGAADNNGIADNERGAWVVPFFRDPQTPNTYYLGLANVYRAQITPGQRPQWQNILSITPAGSDKMEVMTLTNGTTNRHLVGYVARRTDQGLVAGLWRYNINTNGPFQTVTLPYNGWVSAVHADPNVNDTIYIGFSDLENTPGNRGRIYKSTNLGTTWSDITSNFPQNLPVNAIWVDPNNNQTIIVGSDIGVYRSDNGGANWVFWNSGLPNVVVTDFAYYAPTRRLRAGTYGRGLYETPLEAEQPPNQRPTLTIVSPAGSTTVPNATTSMAFSGTASDPDGSVPLVQYRLNSGAWLNATGTTSWSFTAANLAVGANTVEVRAVDNLGLESAQPYPSRSVTREAGGGGGTPVMQHPLVVQSLPPAGGSVALNPGPLVGNQYAANQSVGLTAQPAGGYVFRAWAGDATGSGTTTNVVMSQPRNATAAFGLPVVQGRDAFEPNNSLAEAQPAALTIPGVTTLSNLVMEGPDDWFRLTLPPLTHVRLTIIFEHAQGDLNLQLFDRRQAFGPDEFGAMVGGSFGAGNSEQITYVNINAPQELLARVYHAAGGSNPAYTMIIETVANDDQFSAPGTLDNSSPCGNIFTLNLNQKYENLVLRQSDDWYRFNLPPGTTSVDVRVDHSFFSGDLNVMVVGNAAGDCNGVFARIIGGGFSNDAGRNFEEALNVNVTGQSSILVRVYGANFFMRNLYDLTVTAR